MKLHVNSWELYQHCMDNAVIKTAVDVGANDAGYTKTLVENGFEVYSFEPVPKMFSKLKSRFGNDPRVHCINKALGATAEITKGIQVLSAWTLGKPGMGGLQPTPNEEVAGVFDMEVSTLDRELEGVPVGLIKIDTDGYEHRVWKGGVRTISRWKPAILCEFGCYLHKIGDDPKAFVEDIFSMGYKVVSMDGKNVFRSWREIEPQWPYHSTYDVMLLPE